MDLGIPICHRCFIISAYRHRFSYQTPRTLFLNNSVVFCVQNQVFTLSGKNIDWFTDYSSSFSIPDLGIDCLHEFWHPMSAPFWKPVGVIFHVLSRSTLRWIYGGYDSQILEWVPGGLQLEKAGLGKQYEGISLFWNGPWIYVIYIYRHGTMKDVYMLHIDHSKQTPVGVQRSRPRVLTESEIMCFQWFSIPCLHLSTGGKFSFEIERLASISTQYWEHDSWKTYAATLDSTSNLSLSRGCFGMEFRPDLAMFSSSPLEGELPILHDPVWRSVWRIHLVVTWAHFSHPWKLELHGLPPNWSHSFWDPFWPSCGLTWF